jgi:hypothetical protein
MGEFPTSTATDTELIALGEQLEGLLREYMNAWLEWAPRMRAAHAEAKDNTSALAVAVQRTGCDVAQQRMSELEHDMQPLAERIIAAPVTSLGGLGAKALALWEALPATASQGAFDFPDASRSLFEAVAVMTGHMLPPRALPRRCRGRPAHRFIPRMQVGAARPSCPFAVRT